MKGSFALPPGSQPQVETHCTKWFMKETDLFLLVCDLEGRLGISS